MKDARARQTSDVVVQRGEGIGSRLHGDDLSGGKALRMLRCRAQFAGFSTYRSQRRFRIDAASVVAYRCARALRQRRLGVPARFVTMMAQAATGADIDPGARIGAKLSLAYPRHRRGGRSSGRRPLASVLRRGAGLDEQ